MQQPVQNHFGSEFAGLLKEPGQIQPEDVAYFRAEVFRDGIVSHAEAEALFAMNGGVADKCPAWDEYFVEALAQFVIEQAEPRGHVSHANAQWMIDNISRDGRVEPANELELLVKVLDRAQSAPEVLVGFALQMVTRAVLEGQGPLASGRQLTRGVIGEGEVEIMRRILFAYGGEAGISISRTEAEILFDLNDRTADAGNHPAWRELFVKAMGNYLMAVATDRAPSRAEAVAREEWLDDTDIDVGGTVMGALAGVGELFSRAFLADTYDSAHRQVEKAWAARNARMEKAAAQAGLITDSEADWLIEKLDKDGVIDANERALLDFIRDDGGVVASRLESRLERPAARH